MPRCIVGVALAFVFASLTCVSHRRAEMGGAAHGRWPSGSRRRVGEQQRHAARAAAPARGQAATVRRGAGAISKRRAGDAVRAGGGGRLRRRAVSGPAGRHRARADLGATGTYSQNWLPDRYFEHRTSLIVDPADGRLPPPTPAGAQAPRRGARAGSGGVGASAQDMSLQDRCIHYGFPDLFAAYMSVYRIVQTPEYVAIQMEKIHDVRIIPLDGRPHVSSALRQYLGDSRGRWEGDTLVVETTNFHPNGNPMGGYSTLSDQNLRLVERFRRVADDTHRVHVHRGQPDDVDEAVDGGDQLEAVEGRAARVRLPRGELQPARHAVRRPSRRSRQIGRV